MFRILAIDAESYRGDLGADIAWEDATDCSQAIELLKAGEFDAAVAAASSKEDFRRIAKSAGAASLIAIHSGSPPEFEPEELASGRVQLLWAGRGRERVSAELAGRLRLLAEAKRIRLLLDDQSREQDERESLLRKLVHDMKSPLTVMLMELGMQDRWWEKRRHGRFVQGIERITRNCEELIEMIQNLLDNSRLRQGALKMRFAPMGLGAVLREVLENPPRALEQRDIQLELDLRDANTTISMDASVLSRAFANLLKTAARLSPGGAKIRLACRRSGKEMEIRLVAPGCLEIEQAQSLFQPHGHEEWRPLGVDAGTGIGFNFARLALGEHGGGLELARGSNGIELQIRLPLAEEQE